jgi:hypothetical protein
VAGGVNLLAREKLEPLLQGIGEVVDSTVGAFTMGYAAVVITAVLGCESSVS